MKNLLFIAIASICFCSCMKTYNCKCTPDRSVSGNAATIDDNMELGDNSKTSATKRCEDYQARLKANNYYYTCELGKK